MTIEELLGQREKYDGKEVTVKGYFHGGHEVSELVSKIEKKINKKSKAFERWKISKEAKKIYVAGKKPENYEPPFPYLAEVEATGTFVSEGPRVVGIGTKDSIVPHIDVTKMEVIKEYKDY